LPCGRCTIIEDHPILKTGEKPIEYAIQEGAAYEHEEQYLCGDTARRRS
jgi:hypothetical protein